MNKGLNFCPTPNTYNINHFTTDVNDFCRKIKLKAHFGNKTTQEPLSLERIFKPESNKLWEPPFIHHTVKTFTDAIEKELIEDEYTNSYKKTLPRSNLTKEERIALNSLKNRTDIIISNADKGGAIVIQDVQDYIMEAERQLNDENTYKQIPEDATKMHNELVNEAIDKCTKVNAIPKTVLTSLKTSYPNTPKFYTLPKIHKEGHPGRPVVNSRDCHTSKISKFVDFHLQPLAQSLPSYIKDTTDFLRKIATRKDNERNNILVILDVKSLYTCIPNEEGMKAVQEAMHNVNHPTILTKVITTFLFLILNLNNFIFNGKHYLQQQGVSMGTICAPSYANVFLGSFESKFIYPLIRGKCNLYTRFIDDIFLIWKGTEKELVDTITKLNASHHSIKFDLNYSYSEINFLDTLIYKDENGKLQTKIYRKPSDRPNYLHSYSEHPISTKNSIIFSQALRIKRICSEESEFKNGCEHLKERLKKRGIYGRKYSLLH